MKGRPFFISEKAEQRFYDFLNKRRLETYPETPIPHHKEISDKMIDNLLTAVLQLKAGSKILDVGCGQGLGLKKFKELNFNAVGITINDEDYFITKSLGYNVKLMDQSFLEFDDEEFDFIWARHVLEHSVFPLFTLSEYLRVLKENGYIYIEVPAPETKSHHEMNPNHYSLFTMNVWISLFNKVGAKIILNDKIELNASGFDDFYFFFLLQKTGKNNDE